ncbi:MAG: hypothetical protein KME25_25905 [Symplocastrum torsivum CPER-KK1]|uniref:Uncharacterized protein n=1 Tax=Symplocastrum torsivum CPER-KK1 TaxID=450513 RepID=A0A951PQA9_9CYAN|nr:hypothetical protein [Symplocastrum torsivum CPER-KK1]
MDDRIIEKSDRTYNSSGSTSNSRSLAANFCDRISPHPFKTPFACDRFL